jgi:gluconokinase
LRAAFRGLEVGAREMLMGGKDERLSARAIIVMGVSGSGKSTLASLLGRQLACPFFEGDAFHSSANIAKMSRGEPLTDADRWPWLDKLGEAIGASVRREGTAVAACSALKRAYRDRLRAAIGVPTSFIMLEVGRDELVRRLNSRPDHYMPANLIDSQLAILERPGADERATMIHSAVAPEHEVEQALQWLASEQTDVRRPAKAG